MTEISTPRYDPRSYDRIVVISPIWAATITPAVRTYLKEHNSSIHEITLIVQGGFSDAGASKKEVEDMGFKLNGVLGLMDKDEKVNNENSPLGNNLIKLGKFLETVYTS